MHVLTRKRTFQYTCTCIHSTLKCPRKAPACSSAARTNYAEPKLTQYICLETKLCMQLSMLPGGLKSISSCMLVCVITRLCQRLLQRKIAHSPKKFLSS